MSLYKFINNQYVKLSEQEEKEFLTEQEENTLRIEENLIEEMRKQRNLSLVETDWIILPDSPVSQQKQDEFKVYRQLLRDLPNTIEDINNIQWPIKPAL